MKAVILLGTLKTSGLSNTETLCEFLAGRMAREGVQTEVVKLVDRTILPGTYSDMGEGDEWPEILEKILGAEILVFATPIWWNNASSLTQRAIERLDELHDHVLEGRPSGLEGKAGGIVITGDSDGAQQIIGSLANFLNGVGVAIPPYATLSVLWGRQAKGADPTREELLRKYESDYTETADRMTRQLLDYARRSAG
jgi:multimeric flavodoxin WrbA